MHITYGQVPTQPVPVTGGRSKYVELWAALEALQPAEAWLRVDAADVGGYDMEHKITGLQGSGFRTTGRKVQVVGENNTHLFVRFRDSKLPASTSKPPAPAIKPKPAQPAPAPQPPKPVTPPRAAVIAPVIIPPPAPRAAIPEHVPLAVPAAVAPPPARPPRKPKDPALVSREIEEMLDKLIEANDPEEWLNLSLGLDASWYETFTREVQATAKDRRIEIECDRDGGLLYCRLVTPTPGR